jgi:hypothetical protein
MSVGSSSNSYYGSLDGVIIRRNKFEDFPTSSASAQQIFIQNYLYSTLKAQIKNIYIYSNVFICPINAGINMEGSQSVFIYNNTFIEHHPSATGAHVWVDNNNSSVKVKNNIFYNTQTNDYGSGQLFIRSGQLLANVDANYNLYYRINNNLRIVEKESLGIFHMNDIAGIRAIGLELNSPTPANPSFTSDYHLQSNSPAIGKGMYIAEVLNDFDNKPFGNPRNIGAYASLSTDIDDSKDSNIKIYPTVVGDRITIEGNVRRVQIIDHYGRILIDENINFTRNTIYLNLKPGLYFIKTDNIVSKFIVY